jgi:glycosyltransferase involved in cell wall biosynthesis
LALLIDCADPIVVTVSVSVLIPCYRQDEPVERALESVVKQTAHPVQVILVNDGGGARLDEVLHRLKSSYNDIGINCIQIISLPSNLGAGGARNAGWARARGDYIAFLDADDAWHPRKLEIQYQFMKDHPEIVLSGHRHRRYKSQSEWAGYSVAKEWRLISPWRMLLSNPFITPSVMVKRDCTQRFDKTQRYMEDYFLWLMIAASGQSVAKIDGELAYIYKPSFGSAGLSANLWGMELGELAVYWNFCSSKTAYFLLFPLLACYSFAKYFRRCVIVIVRSF